MRKWPYLVSVRQKKKKCVCAWTPSPLGHVPLSVCRSDYGPWLRVTVCRLSYTASLILSINELSSTLLPWTPSINHNLSSVSCSPHSPSSPLLFLISPLEVETTLSLLYLFHFPIFWLCLVPSSSSEFSARYLVSWSDKFPGFLSFSPL